MMYTCMYHGSKGTKQETYRDVFLELLDNLVSVEVA
jgi:hypothetical protein